MPASAVKKQKKIKTNDKELISNLKRNQNSELI